MERSRSSGSSPMRKDALPKCHRAVAETMGTSKMMTTTLKVADEDQGIRLIERTDLTASSELDSRMAEAMTDVHETTYSVCSLLNVDFPRLVDEHEITLGKFLLNSVYLVISDPEYSIQSPCEKFGFLYNVLTREGFLDVIPLCMQVLRPGAKEHLFTCALLFSQWYKIE